MTIETTTSLEALAQRLAAVEGELAETSPSGVYFVVRDGRGGTSWLTRTLCIQP